MQFSLQGRGRVWHSVCMATDPNAHTVPAPVPSTQRAMHGHGQCHGCNASPSGLPIACTARATHFIATYPPLCHTHYMELCKHCAMPMARNVHEQGHASTVPEAGEGGPMQAACHDGAAPGIPRCPDTSISETATTTTSIGQSPCTNFSAPDPELSDAVLDYCAAMPPAQAPVTGLGSFWDNPDAKLRCESAPPPATVLRRIRTLCTRILNAFKEF